MKKQITRFIFTTGCIFLLSFQGKAQSCDVLNAQSLKSLMVQMGYTVKDLETGIDKEKYTVDIKTSDLNIPVAIELSPSKNFIWLTINLGKPSADTSVTNYALLKQNFSIQPCQFYITAKGSLMMGMAMENRGVTSAIMKRHLDKIVGDVGSTKALWQK